MKIDYWKFQKKLAVLISSILTEELNIPFVACVYWLNLDVVLATTDRKPAKHLQGKDLEKAITRLKKEVEKLVKETYGKRKVEVYPYKIIEEENGKVIKEWIEIRVEFPL